MADVQASSTSAPTPTIQESMAGALDKALGRLSNLEMPVEPKGKQQAAAPAEAAPEPQPELEAGAGDTVAPADAAGDALPESDAAHVGKDATPAATPAESPAAGQQLPWGPQQQIALQEILNANAAMQAELKAFRDQATAAQTAKQQAELPPEQRMASTVQGLQEKLAALEAQLARSKEEQHLAEITQHLNAKPEYGMLKRIPDSAQRIQAMIRQREAEARNRGEVAPAFGVEQAAKMLKDSLMGNLKQLLTDDVKRELGILGESVTPDTVKPRPAKALTGRHTASGSNQKPQGYSPDSQLRAALNVLKGKTER